jgi:predicted nucleic acid-binding protein
MVIVDTTVWIDYLRGTFNPETEWLDRELQSQPLGLSDLSLCEILQGTPEAISSEVTKDLLRFHVFETGGIDLAVAAASNYRSLRRKAYTVRATIDCLIATFCLENDHALLHRDRDFDAFERLLNLNVIHP